MLNNNHQPVCRFADEIVAYLYDEISTRDKTLFENHLAQCLNCTREISDFSSIHAAFTDWRETEFAALVSPQIVIPFESKPAALIFNQPKLSLVDKIRSAFAFQPNWQTVGAALAVLIIGLIAAILLIKNSESVQTADLTPSVNRQNDAPVNSAAVSPTVEIADSTIPPRIEANSPNKNRQTAVKVVSAAEKQPNRLAVNQSVRPKFVPVKNSKPSNFTANRDEALADNKFSKPPHLSGDDDDDISDNSLRLSDLLDETDK